MSGQCSRCDSAADRRYTDAVESLLNGGAVDESTRRAFFEYVDGDINEEEMEYLVGNNGRARMRPQVAARYGYGAVML